MIDKISDSSEPVAQRNSRANLEKLLGDILQQPERRAEITNTIHELFEQEKAVLVLDQSGFSRTVRKHGIVEFLLMIHQMRLLAAPVIKIHQGLIVKAEADNLYCLFDTAIDAVAASRDIKQRLESVNLILPEDRQMYAAIGIGYGRILNVDDADLFGDEVNLASKLGEDLGRLGDVLLTPSAYEKTLAAANIGSLDFREEAVSISGLTFTYYVLQN